MKVLDLNTHSWIEKQPEKKLAQLVAFIHDGDYDIVTLQEVNQLMEEKLWEVDDYFCPVENQRPIKEDNFAKVVVEQLRALGKTYYWSWADAHIGYDRYDEGVAILSKAPLNSVSEWVSTVKDRTDYHTRVLLVGRTIIDGEEVCVASGHFSWWDDFEGEWQKTAALLEAYRGIPLIVMGDFNNPAGVRDEGYDLVVGNRLGLQDAFVAAASKVGEFTVEKAIDGWEGNVQMLRIDLAWVSQDWNVQEYRVVLDGKNGPVVSDHYGIALKLDRHSNS